MQNDTHAMCESERDQEREGRMYSHLACPLSRFSVRSLTVYLSAVEVPFLTISFLFSHFNSLLQAAPNKEDRKSGIILSVTAENAIKCSHKKC